MCVRLDKKLTGQRKGWKIFAVRNGKLYSLCEGPYVADRQFPEGWVKSEGGPGFQAFVRKPDMAALARLWVCIFKEIALRRVALRGDVFVGTIEGMDGYSDGKRGYCAQEVKLL